MYKPCLLGCQKSKITSKVYFGEYGNYLLIQTDETNFMCTNKVYICVKSYIQYLNNVTEVQMFIKALSYTFYVDEIKVKCNKSP